MFLAAKASGGWHADAPGRWPRIFASRHRCRENGSTDSAILGGFGVEKNGVFRREMDGL